MRVSWRNRLAGLATVVAMTLPWRAGAGSPQQITLSPELVDALDSVAPALRHVALDTCCADPLGTIYNMPGRPTSRYQLYITGAPIGIEFPQAAGNLAVPPGRGSAQKPGQSDASAPVPAKASIIFIANGTTNVEPFRIQILPGADAPGRFIAPAGLVLEPLSDRAPAVAPGTKTIEAGLAGFSAEIAKDPPPAGTLYRIADAKQQERLKSIRYLVRAADGLASARRLRPDADPGEYLNFIKQWAIWTRLEQWDLRAFSEEFINRTRKSFESRKQPWTRDLEQTIRPLIPGRWGDVQIVLTTADVLANNTIRR